MRAWLAVFASLATCIVVPAASAATAAPEVLVIGDSVATGMYWHDDAIAIVQKDLGVQWDVAVCRTIGGVSCPFDGARPPTLLQAVAARGIVPPTVVVVAGYNDPENGFVSDVDDAMTALVAAGAKNVLWLTLRTATPEYAAFDVDLAQEEARWPELVLVDWDGVSAGHPTWFQNDFVHLTRVGGLAMAHLVHGAVMQIFDPLHLRPLPLWLHAGRHYRLRLHAEGGTPPYRWHLAPGQRPDGLHVAPNGTLTTNGAPRRGPVTVVVTDADGSTASLPVLTS
jgi:hypothetical protein